jgi:hypothetical protein
MQRIRRSSVYIRPDSVCISEDAEFRGSAQGKSVGEEKHVIPTMRIVQALLVFRVLSTWLLASFLAA